MADRFTVVGTLGQDPEQRATSRGAVVSFRVASTDRRRDAQGNWVDGTTNWYRVNAWGELGQHALISFRRGQRVIVTGDLSINEWDGPDGHKSRSVEIRAAALGHELTFGTSRFERVQRSQPADQGEQPAAQEGGSASAGQAPAAPPVTPPVDHSGEWGASPLADPAPAGQPEREDAPWMTTPF